MVDRVRPLKIETPAEGTETDFFPTEADPDEDYIDTRGLTLQNGGSNDESVILDRNGSGDMVFTDANTGPTTLSQILTDLEHRTIRQLIHFIDEGPAEGFVSGATKTVTGGLFPTLVEWKTQGGLLIVDKTITRSGGAATTLKPTPIVWRMYDTDGTTVLVTVSDAITYSGVNEVSRVRTIS